MNEIFEIKTPIITNILVELKYGLKNGVTNFFKKDRFELFERFLKKMEPEL